MSNTDKSITQTRRPRPLRPAGEQAIDTSLYALIRQAIAELSADRR